MMTNKEKTRMNDLMLACRQALTALIEVRNDSQALKGHMVNNTIETLKDVINGTGHPSEEDIEPVSEKFPRIGTIHCTEEFFKDLLKLKTNRGFRTIQWQGYADKGVNMVEILAECPLFDIVTADEAGTPPEYELIYGCGVIDLSRGPVVRLQSVRRKTYPCALCKGTGKTKGGYKCNCKNTRSKI